MISRVRRVRRLTIASICAVVMGVTLGSIVDSLKASAHAHEQFIEHEIECLTNVIHRESRDQMRGTRYLIAITTIARRDDPDPQWPKTICGLAYQKGQISAVNKPLNMPPSEVRAWEENRSIASEVYHGAWKTQRLPRGWECVRYWKLSDVALSRLSEKGQKQLGITKKKVGIAFFSKLSAVGTFGTLSFYSDPRRCVKLLPTT